MALVIGPMIVAVLFGFVVGSRIHLKLENSFSFTLSAIIALLIFAIFMSWDLGQFPFYNDLSIATAFLSAIVGILLGSALLGNRAQG